MNVWTVVEHHELISLDNAVITEMHFYLNKNSVRS